MPRLPRTVIIAPRRIGQEGGLRYVALGDSYTIGTSVAEAERWPNQLVERLDAPPKVELVANLGVNGYTSRDLIEDELPPLDALNPDFVSVLIGVNDVVQRVDQATYATNVTVILERLLARVPAGRILAVATPDYTVTPQGAGYGDPAQQSAAIERVNATLREAADARKIRFVAEIFELSRGEGRGLVADDGLHPSGSQYALWVDAIAPAVRELLHD
jgi:acyl-CoA thioesterase-1